MRTQDYALVVIFAVVLAIGLVTVTGLDMLLADIVDTLGSVAP